MQYEYKLGEMFSSHKESHWEVQGMSPNIGNKFLFRVHFHRVYYFYLYRRFCYDYVFWFSFPNNQGVYETQTFNLGSIFPWSTISNLTRYFTIGFNFRWVGFIFINYVSYDICYTITWKKSDYSKCVHNRQWMALMWRFFGKENNWNNP